MGAKKRSYEGRKKKGEEAQFKGGKLAKHLILTVIITGGTD